MNFHSDSFYPYQPGGSLPPDSPTYVERSCDNELYKALLAREYCYVLNARQMGKSSLRIQTMRKFQAQGVACAEIELSGIGSQQINANQWYGGIIQELVSGFDLDFNRRVWLQEQEDLSPVQRLSKFIETVLLEQITRPLIIFIDEIDSVLSLKFTTDEFFALIRHCYDQRGNNPEYKRLAFVLLGVATPSDLITDPNATPFNIGRGIDLKGFELDETAPLAQGFIGKADNPREVLKHILYWSGGQPFLTQKICWLAIKSDAYISAGNEKTWVKELVDKQIINHWESQDEPEHLRTIRDRLLRSSRSKEKLLKLYEQILKRKKIAAKDDFYEMELRLSGLVCKYQGKLAIKNPIYTMVFNVNWVRKQLKIFERKKVNPSLTQVGFSSGIIALVIIVMRAMGIFQELELKALDYLMNRLPPETLDERLLIIGADETDLGIYGHPIPDNILAKLLTQLTQEHPYVIGLDLVRDQPVPPGYSELKSHFQNNPNLVAGCAFGGDDPSQFIKSPPLMPPEQIGFFDVYSEDSQSNNKDYIVRRYLLSRTPNSTSFGGRQGGTHEGRHGGTHEGRHGGTHEGRHGGTAPTSSVCNTPYSFGWQLTYRYLQKEGIPVTTQDNNWKFGDVLALRLKPGSGGYQKIDARGNQLLLRYRHTSDPQKLSPRLTFRDVLNKTNNYKSSLVKNRVVLIGVVAASVPDPHDTPYGRIRGLYVHAHLVSQLLSAVEDKNRPLMWWFPWWGDALWIMLWSLTSGILIWLLKNSFAQGIGISLCVLLVYGLCWYGLIQGAWFPFIPSLLAVLTTGISLMSFQIFLRQRNQEKL